MTNADLTRLFIACEIAKINVRDRIWSLGCGAYGEARVSPKAVAVRYVSK